MTAPEWLVSLLAEHAYSSGLSRMARNCLCGHYERPHDDESLNEAHSRHLAEVISTELRERLDYLTNEDCRGYGHMDEHERLAFSEEAVETLIRRHRADAWGDGYETGYDRGDMRLSYDPTVNPYREKGEL